MRFKDKVKYNSVTYFIISILIRWTYNLIAFFYHGFSHNERAIIHLLLAGVSLVFGWMALQLFRRSSPSGSRGRPMPGRTRWRHRRRP